MSMGVAGKEHHAELRQWPLGNPEGRWVCHPSDSRSGGGTFLPSAPLCCNDRLNMLFPHTVAVLSKQWPRRNPRASAYPKGCVGMSKRFPWQPTLWPVSKVAQGRALGNGCFWSLACGPSDTPESFLSSVPGVHTPPSQGLAYTNSWIGKYVRH